MNFQRKRILYILKTQFTSKENSQDTAESWKNIVQSIKSANFQNVFTSWDSKIINAEHLPISDTNFDKTADKIHTTLDGHLQENDSLFDIIWISDMVPTLKKFPPSLLGALKRSVDWHSARIHLVCHHKVDKQQAFLHELRIRHVINSDQIDFLDPKLMWRGTLAFFDEEVLSYQHMGSFELSWKDLGENFEWPQNSQFSQRIKVLSKCSITTVPAYFLTETKFKLKTQILSPEDEITEEFMKDPDMFGDHNCVIAKLERFESPPNNTTLKMSKKIHNLNTEAWKKAILEGQVSQPIDQNLTGKSLKSTYFLIYDNHNSNSENENVLEKTCVVLDPNVNVNGYAKSYDVISNINTKTKDDTSENAFKEALVYDNIDLGILKDFVDQSIPMIVEEFKRRHPEKEYDEEALKQDAIKVIHKYVQDHLQVKHVPIPDDCQDCLQLPYDGYESFPKFDSDERRFLAFIEHTKRKTEEKKKAQNQAVMAPSGDFIVLEAKELVKHFTAEGLPKNPDQCQVLKPPTGAKTKMSLNEMDENDLKKKQNWYDQLLTEFHDIYYNKYENSEKMDMTSAKIQQIYIGSRETASTCHGLNSEQTVVQTLNTSNSSSNLTKIEKLNFRMESKMSSSTGSKPKVQIDAKSNLRRTPRKTKPTRVESQLRPQQQQQPAKVEDSHAIFRKKLRGAVYDALVERKINENDPLFRPCFKKLFDICSVFAQNMPKDTNSTKKWLSVVANQNADSVINLEKALRQ